MTKPILRASDVMTKDILSIDGMANAREVAAMMRSANTTEILVARRSDDDAWGIVTIMDLVKNVIVPGHNAENVLVYEIMTKPVISVPAQMDIRYVIRLMERIGIRRAPVDDNGTLVGMITLYNLILGNDII